MNLGKMVNIFDNNRNGVIVSLEKELKDLIINVKNKYLAEKFDSTFELLKYRITNFKKIELSVDSKYSHYNFDEIKQMQLSIFDAEIGFNHSLLINVWNSTIIKGKLYIWSDYFNDIKIYDQSNKEIEFETFNTICRGY